MSPAVVFLLVLALAGRETPHPQTTGLFLVAGLDDQMRLGPAAVDLVFAVQRRGQDFVGTDGGGTQHHASREGSNARPPD